LHDVSLNLLAQVPPELGLGEPGAMHILVVGSHTQSPVQVLDVVKEAQVVLTTSGFGPHVKATIS